MGAAPIYLYFLSDKIYLSIYKGVPPACPLSFLAMSTSLNSLTRRYLHLYARQNSFPLSMILRACATAALRCRFSATKCPKNYVNPLIFGNFAYIIICTL